MATTASMRQAVRDEAYSAFPNEHPFVIRAAGSFTVGAGTITLTAGDEASFAVGDVVEDLLTGEQFYVTDNSTSAQISVTRGYNGTTAAASDGAADWLIKNPRFTTQQIDQAINDAIYELSQYLVFVWGTGSITLVASQYYYDLTETNIFEASDAVVSVYYQRSTTKLIAPLPFHYIHNVATALSTTGHGIEVWYWGQKGSGDTLYFTYKQQIQAVTDLDPRQARLVVLGAMKGLLGRTITPMTQDPGARTDRVVTPGQTYRDSRWYIAEFDRQAKAEAQLLKVEAKRFPKTQQTSRASRYGR